jgi:hypothetical protein
MKLTAANKKEVISFCRKSDVLTFNYVLYNTGVLGTDCVKNVDGFHGSNYTSMSTLITSFSMS